MKSAHLIAILIVFATSVFTTDVAEASRGGSVGKMFGKSFFSPSITKTVVNPRPKFRKATVEKAMKEATKTKDGSMLCPTCGSKLTGEKQANGRRDFDLDHHPKAWRETKDELSKAPDTTRGIVIDAYQKDVRVQCPECNRSHKFESKSLATNPEQREDGVPLIPKGD